MAVSIDSIHKSYPNLFHVKNNSSWNFCPATCYNDSTANDLRRAQHENADIASSLVTLIR